MLWKLAILIALSSAASAQEVTLNCDFAFIQFYGYICNLNGVTLTDPSSNVVIGGTHEGDRTNADVEIVRIRSSNTPFTIEQIFTTFPNLVEFDIDGSQLQSIRVPPAANLRNFIATYNNIPRIDADSFRNQTSLIYLRLYSNQIQEIDDEAFSDLVNLQSANFVNNQILEINERTFSALESVTYIDLERNNLTRIGDNVFANNRNLINLYLEYNQISAISPTFAANVREHHFGYVNLVSNQCISRAFNFDAEVGWNMMNTALQTCFTNFVGEGNRGMSVEYTGSISVFDQFGNQLLRL